MERFVAIDNVCAWPNLTQLPNGDIIATIFNQPCHGKWEGDVDCYASTDGGRIWKLRGTAAPHESKTNRMNVAAGLSRNGDMIVLASGWGGEGFRGEVLKPWVCRSTDDAKTWTHTDNVTMPDGIETLIPFGDIVQCPDGTLGATMYKHPEGVFFFRSADDGLTWGDASKIAGENYNETDLLVLDDNTILAAARTATGGWLDLFASGDNGDTWSLGGPLTLPGQHPAHLLTLADNRILLVYGIRNTGLYGVGARISKDNGKTWDSPRVLVDFQTATDGGYPSSVQLDDGLVVTAYYANSTPAHQRYHTGAVIWNPDE